MANFDDIIKRLSSTATKFGEAAENISKKTVSKVENLTHEAKIRYALHEVENRIQTNYAAMGESVYTSMKNNTENDDFSEIMGRLDALHDELGQLKQQLKEECGLSICPECESLVGRNNRFCPKCGAKMNDE